MYTLEDIQAVDMEVAQAITDELDRQNSHIELIASENWVSPAVTSRGLNTADMDQIAEAIAMMIKEGEPAADKAKAIVKSLTEKYPLK